MPSNVTTDTGERRAPAGRTRVALRMGAVLLVVSLTVPVITWMPGCTGREGPAADVPGGVDRYPPPPEPAQVIALGTLRSGSAPSAGQVQLARFFFGVDPPSATALVKPSALVADGEDILICDSGVGVVFRWQGATGNLAEARLAERPGNPVAIEVGSDGERLVADIAAGAVLRYGRSGQVVRRYELEGEAFRPSGVLLVGEQVWVSNAAAHRLEIFEAESGRHLRSLGERGRGPGQFACPLGMARTPDGDVCVVDLFNNRVQVFSEEGEWIGNIGRPGNRVGYFGRPKDVAVGPDGTVFVTDAALQCVHAFDLYGQPLLVFGQPGAAGGSLTMPNGVAVTMHRPASVADVPEGFEPAYYVLVAEQLRVPGVRVYAWARRAASQRDAALARPSRLDARAAEDEVGRPTRQTACVGVRNSLLATIPPEEVDAKCLSCHDGQTAPAEPHPIGRTFDGRHVQAPPDWPLVDGRLGCLTCHDPSQRGVGAESRPGGDAHFLREYDPTRPLEFCMHCHTADESAVGPHWQLDGSGRPDPDSCVFCHIRTPEIPEDGRRRFKPQLRDASSALCLSCHTRHWDVSSEGHVDRLVPDRIRRNMIERELRAWSDLDADQIAELLAQPDRRPARMPLTSGRVRCFTCHNPHSPGLFPEGTVLAARARSARDAALRLRVDGVGLCLSCHDK